MQRSGYGLSKGKKLESEMAAGTAGCRAGDEGEGLREAIVGLTGKGVDAWNSTL